MRGDTLYKSIRSGSKMLLLIAGCVAAGAYLHKCQSTATSNGTQDACVVDTITYIDTIPYYEPKPTASRQIGSIVKFLPVFIRPDSTSEAIPEPGNIAMQNIPKDIPDTIGVEIPITQKEYEGEDYHAWISGYDPKMDSIYVYPRHETVTIREPPNRPKRWGVGVFAGYGITPNGFQPCVGVSVHYTLWNF